VQVRLSARGFAAVTLSDGAGRFEFVGLPAGRYALSFTKPGFVMLRYGQRDPSDESTTVDIEDGQTLERIDVALSRAAAIEGRVSDETGEPLAEASVTAMRAEFVAGEQRIVPAGRQAVTNDKGEYRLYGLQPGEYYVSAILRATTSFTSDPLRESTSSEKSGYAPAFFPAANSVDEAQLVTVASGKDATAVDITFRPIRLARVSGTVVTSRGKFLDGAHVMLKPAGSVSVSGKLLPFLGMSQLGSGGEFGISAVPPGVYVLQARSIPLSVVNEIATTGRSAPLVSAPEGEIGVVSVTVSGADVTGLTITTSVGGRLRGHVVADGQALTSSTTSKISVLATPVGADSVAMGHTQVVLGRDGAFDIRGVVGRFVLRATGLPTSLTLGRVELNGADVTDGGVTVGPGEEISDVQVLVKSISTQIAGHVTAPANVDLSRCTVIVFSDDVERWSWPATRYISTTRPERDGSFRVEGLPPGRYLVYAVGSVERGRWLDPSYLKGISGRAIRVELREGQTQSIYLPLQ
jgi:hypothetical protein